MIFLYVVGGLFLAGIAIAGGIVVALPLGFGFGVFKLARWQARRPIPTRHILAITEQRLRAAGFPDTDAFAAALAEQLIEAWQPQLPNRDIFNRMTEIATALYQAEALTAPLPPAPAATPIEEGRYRDQLLLQARKCADPRTTLTIINGALSIALSAFRDALPQMATATVVEIVAEGAEAPLATVPIIDLMPKIGQMVWDVSIAFYSDAIDELKLFGRLKRQLGYNEKLLVESAGKYIPAYDHTGPPREIVAAYLGSTPLARLFDEQVPFVFTDRQRYEHTHVIGGSGHGKTQLLQHLIYRDLMREEPPALIVIDSQGDMLNKIQRLELFAQPPLADRLVIIDPEDVEYPPALNMFDMTNARLAGYSRAHREQIEAGVIELYNYVFGALAAELTQKQGTAFAFVSRLMLSIPGATIHTLRELMEDDAPSLDRSRFADHIARLDPTALAFFQNQFFSRAFQQTRQQIARRLYGVLQVPAFDRMFSAPSNKLDMFGAIQNGRIVLINTSKALLKNDASALFGRYMIALAMRAIFERVAVRRHDPAFLIVDEAAEYFDDNLETLLSQARKYNMGVLFAHQHLEQLSPHCDRALPQTPASKLPAAFPIAMPARSRRTCAPAPSSSRRRASASTRPSSPATSAT
jgi:type IV secretion system coupling TraD/TrwB family protein